MRKYLYLITEHEDEERVGLLEISDSRSMRPLKNEEASITVVDVGKRGFRDIGKKVGMGYADFGDEDDYEVRVREVLEAKLVEVDDKWLRKAGHEDKIGEVPA